MMQIIIYFSGLNELDYRYGLKLMAAAAIMGESSRPNTGTALRRQQVYQRAL